MLKNNFGESGWFNINNKMRQGCVMSSRLFNLHINGIMKRFNVRDAKEDVKLMENGKVWKLSCFLNTNDLVFVWRIKRIFERISKEVLKGV